MAGRRSVAGRGLGVHPWKFGLVRDALASLPNVRLIEPERTFLLWLDLHALDLGPDELTGFLRRDAGWAVTRGPAFGDQGIGFARVNIACTRARLATALKRLTAAVRTLQNTE